MRATLKINPDRLPKPLLPPTKEVHIVDESSVYCSPDYSSLYQDSTTREEHERKTRIDAWTPEQDEKIWRMYYEEKKTQRQIGEEMGRTLISIRSRLQRLRQRKEFK